MNYHDIKNDDMLNGAGIRVTLFVAGCDHGCMGCHNSQTWNPKSGIPFDESAKTEFYEKLNKDYISGATFSGGDPLYCTNRNEIGELVYYVKHVLNKNVWLYTGFLVDVKDNEIYFKRQEYDETFSVDWIKDVDVIVDGIFDIECADETYHWGGSTNQRVIKVKDTIEQNKIVLFDDYDSTSKFKEKYAQIACGCDS